MGRYAAWLVKLAESHVTKFSFSLIVITRLVIATFVRHSNERASNKKASNKKAHRQKYAHALLKGLILTPVNASCLISVVEFR